MSIIPYLKGNQTYYSHISWFSRKQKRRFQAIPRENNRLAYYYAFSSLALSAILARKVPLVGGIYNKLGVYTGICAITATSFVVSKLLLSYNSKQQLRQVVEDNDCWYTPFWKNPNEVVDLPKRYPQAADRAMYLMRLYGQPNTQEQVKVYNPDFILEHPSAKQKLIKMQIVQKAMAGPKKTNS